MPIVSRISEPFNPFIAELLAGSSHAALRKVLRRTQPLSENELQALLNGPRPRTAEWLVAIAEMTVERFTTAKFPDLLKLLLWGEAFSVFCYTAERPTGAAPPPRRRLSNGMPDPMPQMVSEPVLLGRPEQTEALLAFIGETPSPLVKAALRQLLEGATPTDGMVKARLVEVGVMEPEPA